MCRYEVCRRPGPDLNKEIKELGDLRVQLRIGDGRWESEVLKKCHGEVSWGGFEVGRELGGAAGGSSSGPKKSGGVGQQRKSPAALNDVVAYFLVSHPMEHLVVDAFDDSPMARAEISHLGRSQVALADLLRRMAPPSPDLHTPPEPPASPTTPGRGSGGREPAAAAAATGTAVDSNKDVEGSAAKGEDREDSGQELEAGGGGDDIPNKSGTGRDAVGATPDKTASAVAGQVTTSSSSPESTSPGSGGGGDELAATPTTTSSSADSSYEMVLLPVKQTAGLRGTKNTEPRYIWLKPEFLPLQATELRDPSALETFYASSSSRECSGARMAPAKVLLGALQVRVGFAEEWGPPHSPEARAKGLVSEFAALEVEISAGPGSDGSGGEAAVAASAS